MMIRRQFPYSAVLFMTTFTFKVFGQEEFNYDKYWSKNNIDTTKFSSSIFLSTQPEFSDNKSNFIDTVFFDEMDPTKVNSKNYFVSIRYFESGIKKKVVAYYDYFKNKYFESNLDSIGRSGNYFMWYPNGNLQSFNIFKNDDPILPDILFYKSGVIRNWDNNNVFPSNLCKSRSYYENGKLEQEMRLLNLFSEEEVITTYFENGNIRSVVHQGNPKSPYEYYYLNGKIRAKGNNHISFLFLTGKCEQWYDNGIKKIEYYFNEPRISELPNQPIGEWKYWDKKGKLVKTEVYDNGKKISEKIYQKNYDMSEFENLFPE